MKRILFTVATLGLACAAFALGESSNANQINTSQPQISVMQDQAPAQPETRMFIGTIAKNGDAFVLRTEAAKNPYQLDDQASASKFAGKKVKVTGVLDASNNTIHVQTIEEENA
ncbi:MAG: DUF5818 domain-containing protein [Candidatus Acidiferrales bacterium]